MTVDTMEVPRLADQFCFPLYASAKEAVRQYRDPLEDPNHTYTQYLVMTFLWELDGMTERAPGKKVHLSSGTLAPLLKCLDRAGYVNRVRADNDERMLYLTLTEKGEALKEKAKRIPGAMQGCIPLSKEELALLRALLKRALDAMVAQDEEE